MVGLYVSALLLHIIGSESHACACNRTEYSWIETLAYGRSQFQIKIMSWFQRLANSFHLSKVVIAITALVAPVSMLSFLCISFSRNMLLMSFCNINFHLDTPVG